MIKFMVTAVFVILGLFVMVVVLSLMLWVVLRLLRVLFPSKFTGPVKVKAKKEKKDAD